MVKPIGVLKNSSVKTYKPEKEKQVPVIFAYSHHLHLDLNKKLSNLRESSFFTAK